MLTPNNSVIMKRFIADVYKIVYKRTDNKLLSVAVAVLYISALNVCTFYGLCLLLSTWQRILRPVVYLFRFPYIFGVFVLAVALHFWLILPLQNLSAEKKKPVSMSPIIFYSIVALLIFVYSQVADKLF